MSMELIKADQLPEQQQIKIPDVLPVLPLPDVVVFPYMIVPLFVNREQSAKAVDQALAENRMIMLVAQKDPNVEIRKPWTSYFGRCPSSCACENAGWPRRIWFRVFSQLSRVLR
jgi:Lon protease-like protein